MTTIYWCADYVAAAEAFDTTRKSEWIVETLIADPIAGIRLAAPPPLPETAFREIHHRDYLEAVHTGTPRALAESQGFQWDPGLWTSSLAHAAGMVAAARHALRTGQHAGSLSSGMHHARRGSGSGFCTLNGVAMAAKQALQAGAGSVLIIDLDAHCGGGTHSLIATDNCIRQLDIAVDPFDAYDPLGANSLDLLRAATGYLSTLRTRLEQAVSVDPGPDLCIYYAGMDVFESCRIGGLTGMTMELIAERERIVFDECRALGIPVAFGIGGGYANNDFTRAELAALHRLTIRAAAA